MGATRSDRTLRTGLVPSRPDRTEAATLSHFRRQEEPGRPGSDVFRVRRLLSRSRRGAVFPGNLMKASKESRVEPSRALNIMRKSSMPRFVPENGLLGCLLVDFDFRHHIFGSNYVVGSQVVHAL